MCSGPPQRPGADADGQGLEFSNLSLSLMDGLRYSRFLLADGDGNPIVFAVAILYGLYQSILLIRFVAFFTLNFLSTNAGRNRLVWYNMQQAIFIDIALFFLDLLLGLTKMVLPVIGVNEPSKLPAILKIVLDRMLMINAFDKEGRYIPRDVRENDDDKGEDKDKKK